MSKRLLILVTASAGLAVASAPAPAAAAAVPRTTAAMQLGESYGRLPLSFEANRGQADAQVRFLSQGRGYTLFLAAREVVLCLRGSTLKAEKDAHGEPTLEAPLTDPPATLRVVRIKLVGANPDPEVTGVDELPGKSHYLIGNDPGRWRKDIPHYARVNYQDVYAGVDVVYHGDRGRLEYDFVVSPGSDARRIRLRFEGPDEVWLDEERRLVLRVGETRLVQHAPYAYQDGGGVRRQVPARYVLLDGGEVGFEIAAYDATQPLVIDPVLEYSTYLGGGGDEFGYGIAVDGAGSAYVVGQTTSTDFPTTNPLQTDRAISDVFVTKLSPSGSSLVYSTYLGGDGSDIGQAVAVDAAGRAYVTGTTSSTDFPTLNPYQASQGGLADAFVTMLSPSGSSLVYSTYLGGSSLENCYGIAIDGAGSAYVTGFTDSTSFPTLRPVQANQAARDAFVTKFSPAGSSLVYSTYLGGDGNAEGGDGIVADASGNAYVTGYTNSTDFPTLNPIQTHQVGTDVFVTKLSQSGALVYSTYLGGNDTEFGLGIDVDGSGNAYVTGSTDSFNFPTLNPYQTNQSSTDAFVAKLSPSGSALAYSTYLGGNLSDSATGIFVDASGSAYVAGYTSSSDFPTLDPYQTDQALMDAFVTRLSASGSTLQYSTYLGGSDNDYGWAVDVDGSGRAYVTGHTYSTDFPVLSAHQTDQALADVFVTRFEGGAASAAFYTLTPCRVADTRNPVGPLGGPALACAPSPLARTFDLAGVCGIPSTARAVSYNATVTEAAAAGNLRVFPGGTLEPLVSSINYSAGTTRANNGIVALGTGSLSVSCHQASGTSHVIIDVNGYFE
jgi:hypothetical protein